jgi:hypothetical protein
MKSFFRYLVFAAALLSLGGMVQAADAQMPVFLATPQYWVVADAVQVEPVSNSQIPC